MSFDSVQELGGSHPLEVAIHAGALGLPIEIWSKSDRQAAKSITGCMARPLTALAAPTKARYGAIRIESRFPSPAALAGVGQSREHWPTTQFWGQVGAAAETEQERLVSELSPGVLSRSKEGTLFRSRQPWSNPRIDQPTLERVVRFLERVMVPSD